MGHNDAQAGDWQTWAISFAALSLMLVVNHVMVDPMGPRWAVGGAAVTAVVCTLLALRQRQDAWAFVGGLCVNLAVTLPIWHAHQMDLLTVWWLPLVQANVLAVGGVSLAWLLASRCRLLPGGLLLNVQIGVALAGNALLLAGPLSAIVTWPDNPLFMVIQAGSPLGWLTWAAATVAAAWRVHRRPGHLSAGLLVGCGLAAGVLAACSAAPWDQGHWLAYHILMASWVVVAGTVMVLAVMLALSGKAGSAQTGHSLRMWAVVLGILLIGLALRAVDHDATGPLAASATLLCCAALSGCMAVWLALQRYVVASGVLVSLAVTVYGVDHGQTGPLAVVLLNVLALAASGLVWVVLEVWLRNRTISWYLRYGVTAPFAHVAIQVALAGLAVLAGITSFGVPIHILTWPTIVVVLLALFASLWDADASFPLAGTYALALVAILFVVPRVADEHLWLLFAAVSVFVFGGDFAMDPRLVAPCPATAGSSRSKERLADTLVRDDSDSHRHCAACAKCAIVSDIHSSAASADWSVGRRSVIAGSLVVYPSRSSVGTTPAISPHVVGADRGDPGPSTGAVTLAGCDGSVSSTIRVADTGLCSDSPTTGARRPDLEARGTVGRGMRQCHRHVTDDSDPRRRGSRDKVEARSCDVIIVCIDPGRGPCDVGHVGCGVGPDSRPRSSRLIGKATIRICILRRAIDRPDGGAFAASGALALHSAAGGVLALRGVRALAFLGAGASELLGRLGLRVSGAPLLLHWCFSAVAAGDRLLAAPCRRRLCDVVVPGRLVLWPVGRDAAFAGVRFPGAPGGQRRTVGGIARQPARVYPLSATVGGAVGLVGAGRRPAEPRSPE